MTRSTTVNALIGAAVSLVLSFVPFSPVLGGAVAGYLEGRDGLKVGGISGVIAAIPLILVFVLFLSVFMFAPANGGVGIWLLFGGIAVFALLYSVALSALGGWVGVYLSDRRRERRDVFDVERTARVGR